MGVSIKKAPKIIFLVALFMLSATLFSSHAQLPNVYEQVTTVDAYVHYDFDYDGMHNWWELLYGLDPLDPTDAPLDYDGDTLTNLVEFYYLTSPINRDTDGGGVWDNLEIEQCLNPLENDDDHDGNNCISDDETSPTKDPRADSDGDGVDNLLEDKYGTNRQSVDTDGDGLNDYDEIFKYPTNPLEPDSDFDGINDFDELLNFFTDPNNRDSDFDGLLDADEIYYYGTNPTNWDTDGGGMSDSDEYTNNSNPKKQDDDFQFTWSVYYGSQPNDVYKSLENNKIDIYQGMDLVLEAIKPFEAKQVTIGFNDKELTTQKDYIKLKLLSPKEPGLYKITFTLDLKSDQTIIMTKFVEVRQTGKVVSRVDGTFNDIYKNIDYFNDGPVADAKIEVFEYNEFTGEMELFQADVASQSDQNQSFINPRFTDSKGSYLLPLRPGNYLIRISKAKYGSKEMLYDTNKHTIYSQDTYLTYNYDPVVWGLIFMSTFLSVWLAIKLINYISKLTKMLASRFPRHKAA